MRYVKGLSHTVPIETPQSMFEEPSRGSKTTQYLQTWEDPESSVKAKMINNVQPKVTTYFPRSDGSTKVASSSSSDTRMHCEVDWIQMSTSSKLNQQNRIHKTKKNCFKTHSPATAYQSFDKDFIRKHIKLLLLLSLRRQIAVGSSLCTLKPSWVPIWRR